jgi:hypothetical protein
MKTDVQVIDYLSLRKLIGFIGFFLPSALVTFQKIAAPGSMAPSISDYYYTPSRNILVGALCAVGVFLLTYRGYDKDYIWMRLACFWAIGVAMFPTVPVNPSTFNNIIGIFHGIFATLMFSTLTYVCLFLFTKSDKPKIWRTIAKERDNVVYKVCGIMMATSMILIPLALNLKFLKPYHPMFWLETIIVMAFGFSWLVKGKAMTFLGL